MEGKPIDECPLYLFLNLTGSWTVVASSPSMDPVPLVIDNQYVIRNFRNGEALLLERSVTPPWRNLL